MICMFSGKKCGPTLLGLPSDRRGTHLGKVGVVGLTGGACHLALPAPLKEPFRRTPVPQPSKHKEKVAMALS